mgnify:CR=1 FL=1
MVKKTKSDSLKEVRSAAGDLLSALGLEAKTEALEDKENAAVVIQLETSDPGILIGHHGETLAALQLVLSQIIKNRTGEWQRLLVNVGDWRERREETLKNLAQSVAERVKQTGEAQPIYDLTAAERRLIHLELADDPEVETESEGEGRERHLLVKPKK